MTALAVVNEIQEIIKSEFVSKQFDAVLSDKQIQFQREAEFALQHITKNNFAVGIARKNKLSLENAIINVAAIGITLNPAQRLAYLVPRKDGIVLEIGYMGLLHIAVESGSVRFAQSRVVRKGGPKSDTFVRRGFDQAPVHEFDEFATAEERGPIVGVYCVAKLDTGDWMTETMSLEEVFRIRDRTESWKAFEAARQKGEAKKTPWITDEEEMIKKTCIRRAYKAWPRRERLDQAIHYMNTEGGEGLHPSEMGGGHDVIEPKGASYNVSSIIGSIEAAQTIQELNKARRYGQALASDARDKTAYERITAAARKRRDQIEGVVDADLKEAVR